MARVSEGKLTLLPDWDYGPTTLRHVAEFAKQTGTFDQLAEYRKETRKAR